MTEPRELRRLCEIQKLIDNLTDPGPLLVWPDPFELTGRPSKTALARRIEGHAAELRSLRQHQAKIAQGLLLLLRRELP